MREAVFIVVRLDLDFKLFKTYITSTFNIKYPTMENKRKKIWQMPESPVKIIIT